MTMVPPVVILVRHAHAEWPGYTGRDFDRPLTPKGEHDAARTARALQQAGHSPTLMLVSPARRTRQTARIIVDGLGLDEGIVQFDGEIYNATPATLLSELRKAASRGAGCVMLVAHNPGISELARQLAGDEAPALAPADWRVLSFPMPVQAG